MGLMAMPSPVITVVMLPLAAACLPVISGHATAGRCLFAAGSGIEIMQLTHSFNAAVTGKP